MNKSSFAVIAAVLAILAVSSLVPTAEAASKGLQCQNVWTGPSKDNDLMKCMTNTERLTSTAGNYVLPALCILFFVLTLLIFPIIFCCCVCCQCCCDCCKEVPKGRKAESKGSRKNLVILMVIILGIAIAILALMITGGSQLVKAADDIFVNLNKHIVEYFLDLIDRLSAATIDPTTGNYTDPFSNKTFDDIKDQINSVQNTTESYHDALTTYSGIISSASYGLAVFPLFWFSFTFLFALCNCRKCCPSCCTCVYWLIGIIFSILGFILLLLGSVFGDVCAEIDLQQSRQPGLFQWYVIPTCEGTANFTDYKSQITNMEADFASQVCTELSKYCSASATYNIANTQDFFVCSTTNATAKTDCPTFSAATVIVNNAFAKSGSPVCAGNCSFRQCPTDCVDTNLQKTAEDALKLLDSANRLFNALDIVLPLMDCDVLVDRVLRIFDSCAGLRDGLTKIGIGFFLTLIGIVFAWIVMFRGQKVWFKDEDYEEDERAEIEMDGGNAGKQLPSENYPNPVAVGVPLEMQENKKELQ